MTSITLTRWLYLPTFPSLLFIHSLLPAHLDVSPGEYGGADGVELLHDLQRVLDLVGVAVHEPPAAHVHPVVEEVFKVK